MEDNPYYDGLSQNELAFIPTSFIVPMEAAWYCKSLDKEDIRFSRLEISNDSLCEKTKGERTDFGGNFVKIIRCYEREGFLRINKVSKKKTLIYPNIPLIEKEVKRKQIENLSSPNKSLYRILKPGDTINRARALSDSVQISDRLGMIVTRANPKKVPKRSKHISSV
jgi:hypothetical protein